MAFLVFEGIDGSGKSTLIKALRERLNSDNIEHIFTREPGGTTLGDEIRNLLLKTDGEAPVPRAESLMYQASRAQLVDKVIMPAINAGTWVLCDRYTASSMAFQAGGRKLPEGEIEWLNNYATNNLKPDLWVLLDLPVEESSQRMGKREQEQGQKKDRFEIEKQEFHQNVRDYYLKMAEKDQEKWLVIDAALSPEEIQTVLITELQKRGLIQ